MLGLSARTPLYLRLLLLLVDGRLPFSRPLASSRPILCYIATYEARSPSTKRGRTAAAAFTAVVYRSRVLYQGSERIPSTFRRKPD